MLSNDARRLWEAARGLQASALARSGPAVSRPAPPLLFFTDPGRTPRPWDTAARLPEGSAVVYRHFGVADAKAVAGRLREITRLRGVRLLIGLDGGLAEHIGADGLHLPERALTDAAAIRQRHPTWLLTGAVHSLKAVRTAPRDGLDALVLSPIFLAGGASASRPALGVAALRDAADVAACPIYALGGIGPGNVDELVGSGACGLAGVEAIQTAFAA